MRVAMLSYHTSPLHQPGVGDSGGMNVYVRRLASSLARRGIDCDIYTRADAKGLDSQVRLEPGLIVHHIAAGPMTELSKEELYGHIGTFADSVLEKMITQKECLPDVIHANYWLSGIAGHAIKHELGVPLMTSFHTLEKAKQIGRIEPDDEVDSTTRIRHEQQIMNCSEAILVSCAPEARWVQDLYGARPSQVRVVHPGVEMAFFSPGEKGMARAALGLDPEAKIVLFAGRIQPLKGGEIALEAAEILRKFHEIQLVVIGGPSGHEGEVELQRLKDKTREAQLAKSVLFVPPQPHELMSSYYRAADVCIVPSRTESFGLVALEALACGTPVVASAVGGLMALVENGRSGYLVGVRDAASFAKAIDKVISNPARAARLSKGSIAKATEFSWGESASAFLAVHRDLMDEELLECG